VESRKRIKEETDTEGEHDDDSAMNVYSKPPALKKLKINVKDGKPRNMPFTATPTGGSKTPLSALKIKHKPKTILRPAGSGYDSEAEDQEKDPQIEEGWILRMMPGEDCDYLQWAIREKKFGPKHLGGADIHMRFYDSAGRRCAITIRGRSYAATMVDLPCIIEGMKSWDRRGFFKSNDICQMMLVFAQIDKEEDAKTIELPKNIDPNTFQYPHGLTAPMYNARKRRFRKRVAQHTLEAVEEAVEALLKRDKEALGGSTFEVVEAGASRRATSTFTEGDGESGQEYGNGEEDAEGEDDNGGYFGVDHHGVGEVQPPADDELSMDLERQLEEEMEQDSVAATPMSTNAVTSMDGSDAPQVKVEEDSGDESVEAEDDEDDDGGEEEIDEEEKARQAQIQGTREDIAEVEKQIASIQASLAVQSNPILKKRLGDNIKKLNEELQLKKALLGEDDD